MDMENLSTNVCRLCAEMIDPRSCVPLYTEDKRERLITKQINQLVVNLISPDDGLPQEICLKCSRNVELCYSFVSNVIETQKKLKRNKQKMTQNPNKNDFIKNYQSETTNNTDGDVTNENKDEHREQELDTVDDFIELLVVHPEEMVEMDMNAATAAAAAADDDAAMLDVSSDYVCVTKENIARSSEDRNSPRRTWNEEMDAQPHNHEVENLPVASAAQIDDDDDDDDENPAEARRWQQQQQQQRNEIIIKEEPKEVTSIFSSNYIAEDDDEQVVELQEQSMNWMYDGRESAGEECHIIYKCGSCARTFESEHSFQSHNCEGDDDAGVNSEVTTFDAADESKKAEHFFHCELCDRIFKSKFVFKLHCAQHKKSNLCHLCNVSFVDAEDLLSHLNQMHPYANFEIDQNVYEEVIADSEKQCDVCGKITENLKQHKLYHAIKELEYCKAENKKFLKKWFYCQKCNKKIFSEANYLFHVAKHNGEETVSCRQCNYIAVNIQDYNMHITTHTGGKYFICNDCEKCFFTRSAISDHVLIHMDGTRYMCEICGKRFKTSRSNAQHKLLQHKKYFRCNRCNRGFTHEAKLKSHYNICRVINQDHKESKVFEPVEKFFCNICNSNIKSSSEISILFHKAKHEGKDGVECKFCNLLCKNACMYKNHLLIHTNQRPFACTQCPKSFRTKGCLVQHMLVHGDEYKYTCEYCGKKSKKLTTHVNHVNIHTDTKPYKCPDCDRPFRQLSDMKKHRRTHLKYKAEAVTVTELPYLTIKTEVEDMMAAESIQQLQLT